MLFLQTKSLLLRSVEAKDVVVMYDYRNNPICARYQRGQSKSRADIENLIKQHKDDVMQINSAFFIALAEAVNNEMIGEIVVMPNGSVINLGYTISYRYHRRGYAFEALTALIFVFQEKYPEHTLVCLTDPNNQPSMALLKKLDFTDSGYMPEITSQIFKKRKHKPVQN